MSIEDKYQVFRLEEEGKPVTSNPREIRVLEETDKGLVIELNHKEYFIGWKEVCDRNGTSFDGSKPYIFWEIPTKEELIFGSNFVRLKKSLDNPTLN